MKDSKNLSSDNFDNSWYLLHRSEGSYSFSCIILSMISSKLLLRATSIGTFSSIILAIAISSSGGGAEGTEGGTEMVVEVAETVAER